MNMPALASAADLAHRPGSGLLMSTTDDLPGWRIVRTLGLVRGNTVRARNLGVDFVAGLKALVGGEIGDYTKMLAESREQSIDRMRAEALQLGANAIVTIRFTTSTVMQGAAEILVYGTAVIIEAAGGHPPQGQPGGYPPQGQPGGYPPQGQPGGYPPQGQPGGYPPQGAPGPGGAMPGPGQHGPGPGQGHY